MLRRLYLIFLRYAEHNLSAQRQGGDLVTQSGLSFGTLDSIELRGNRLTFSGWSDASRIGVILNRTRLWTVPDVAQPGSSARGFTLEIPFETGDPILQVDDGPDGCTFEGFTAGHIQRARAMLVIPFLVTLVGLISTIWAWKKHGDLGAREVVKQRLGLVPAETSVEMNGDVLAPLGAQSPQIHDRVTIVMPVFNAFDVLGDCLARVEQNTDLDWHLIAIEDRSTDERVWPLLQDWATRHEDRVTLLRNDTNVGFVTGANRGLLAAADRDAPVVLLNSDALVPKYWASRLLAPLADKTVATVTPLSNDAEIFTVPIVCQRYPLAEKQVDALDTAAQTLNGRLGLVDAPTGVGFCMAMSPEFLRQIPTLDTAFGRGYGEETDWCQKAAKLGGRNVCVPNLFVEHRGGVSFGSATKQALLERNGGEISRRYPKYDAEVQAFIKADPLNTTRLAMGLSWASMQQDEVPLYLAHTMGGGAEKFLQDHMTKVHLSAGESAVVLRVGGGHTWRLELHTPLGITMGRTNDTALIEQLLARVAKMRLTYSCGVGCRDAATLPAILLRIARGEGRRHPIEMLFHDFYPISPSYTLLGRDGTYRGVPVAGGPLADDPAHEYTRPGQPNATLAQWQDDWGALIAAAERCLVFSQNSADLVVQAYPQAADTLVVKPHPILAPVPRITAPDYQVPVIAVLGSIGYQKGAAVLQRLSHDLARSNAARLVVIGHLDPAWPLAAPAVVHGSYEVRDLTGLVARYGITGWFLPSIWPETFSFVTHEALATGMPVVCFDLGAQGDAVRAAIENGAAGGVLPIPEGQEIDTVALLAAISMQATDPKT